MVKREARRIRKNSWDTYIYISSTDYDVHGCQETAYKILIELNKTGRVKIQLNSMPNDE
jgi:hypothetical protein